MPILKVVDLLVDVVPDEGQTIDFDVPDLGLAARAVIVVDYVLTIPPEQTNGMSGQTRLVVTEFPELTNGDQLSGYGEPGVELFAEFIANPLRDLRVVEFPVRFPSARLRIQRAYSDSPPYRFRAAATLLS